MNIISKIGIISASFITTIVAYYFIWWAIFGVSFFTSIVGIVTILAIILLESVLILLFFNYARKRRSRRRTHHGLWLRQEFHSYPSDLDFESTDPLTSHPTQPLGSRREIPPPLDLDRVRFIAYYPPIATIGMWNTLLVYISSSLALPNIQRDASRFWDELGQFALEHPRSASAMRSLVVGTPITVIPQYQGVQFNPPFASFRWLEDWHRVNFRFKALEVLTEQAGNGEISIYAGPLLFGTIKMPLLFTDQSPSSVKEAPEMPFKFAEEVIGKPYQQLFVSYSHEDSDIVEICRNIYEALGLTVLIDVDTLRSGQIWNKALERMIDNADIFQLFWSELSAKSPYVRQEWMYAFQHTKGEGFIRPVYWQKPLVPPPNELADYHFAYLPPDTFTLASKFASDHFAQQTASSVCYLTKQPMSTCECMTCVYTRKKTYR